MDACFSLVGSSSESHQKFPIHFVQMVGDEWSERLFTLPKWIMKNTDNLIQHSKHILNSEYGKCIVLHTVTLSRDILCGGHLLFATEHPFSLCLELGGFHALLQPYGLGGVGPLPKSRGGPCLA